MLALIVFFIFFEIGYAIDDFGLNFCNSIVEFSLIFVWVFFGKWHLKLKIVFRIPHDYYRIIQVKSINTNKLNKWIPKII